MAVNGHLPGWLARPGVDLVAGADVFARGREALLAGFPAACWYDSAETLLASEDLDFVDICTPPATHAGLIREALERGLHVLCEKPLVLDRRDLSDLASLAERKGKVLYTVHNWRHAPASRKIGNLLREGALGEVERCRWETLRSQPAVTAGNGGLNWRVDPALSGGGILIDHGWHALYLLHGWLGESPLRLSARLETRKHREWPLEDTASLSLEYASKKAEILLTWAADERRNLVELTGAKGTLTVEGRSLKLSRPSGAVECLELSQSLSEGSHHPDWFSGVVDGFLSEVEDPMLKGKKRRGRNLAEASLCLDLISLAKESSARDGEWLEVRWPA